MGAATIILQNKRLALGAVVVVAGVLYAYTAWVPDLLSREYMVRLKPLMGDIKTAFRQVESGLGRQIFQTPSQSADERQRDLDALAEINLHARQKLDAIAKIIPGLQKPPPGTGFFGAYNDAASRQSRAYAILSQSREVLANYDTLISFLRTYYRQQARVEAELTDINSVPDTNLLQGQHGELYQVANQVYAYAAEIKNTAAPNDFKDFRVQAAQHFDNVAKGFEQLAYGVSISVDEQIYAGMRMLEDAALEHVDINNTLFGLFDSSSTIRNAAELPSKAESLAE